ncbi:unnamed protein product [Discula destructiva]
MDIKETTARLRRTFHYPTDDSSSSNGGGTPEVLDEEEQEDLIKALAEQNASTNQQYQILLLALPILSSIPYILALFRPSTLLVALLGLTSLSSTVFLLFSLPITETGIPFLDAWARSGSKTSKDNDDDDTSAIASGSGTMPSGLGTLNQMRRRRRTNSVSFVVPKSPLEKHLPYLNVGLCVILILSGILANRVGGDEESRSHHRHHFGWLGLGNLPAIVYGVVLIAKMVMASVDPERELQRLRYDYKGA